MTRHYQRRPSKPRDHNMRGYWDEQRGSSEKFMEALRRAGMTEGATQAPSTEAPRTVARPAVHVASASAIDNL